MFLRHTFHFKQTILLVNRFVLVISSIWIALGTQEDLWLLFEKNHQYLLFFVSRNIDHHTKFKGTCHMLDVPMACHVLGFGRQKKIIDQMIAFGSRVCRWGQSCPPINRKIVAGGYEPLCFVKFTCIRQFFCSSFQKCLLQHLMGKSEFKKGRATPSAKTQRQPACFHMFPCVIGTRRLKKNPFEFEVVRWVEGKGCRTHNLHRFTVICGILWRCWGTCLVLAAWGLGLFRPTMVVGHLNVTDAQGIAMQKWSYGMHTWYPLVSYDHGIWWVFKILSPTSRSRHFCSCEGGWDAEHWRPRAELSQLRPCCIASVFCIASVLVRMLKVQFREKDDRMGLTPRAKWPGCLQWKCPWR